MPPSFSILHVLSAPAAGGAETYVRQLAIELKRIGHRPSIAFVGHALDHGRSPEFEAQYLTELENANIDYFFIGDSTRRNPLLGAWRVRQYSRSKGVQVYQSHLTLGIIFGALLRVPRIYTHHSSVTRLPVWAYKFLNAFVEQYVGISEICARHLRRFTDRDVAVVRNGVDITRFRPRVRTQLGSVINAICVGRIFAPKNYKLLINSIALLPLQIKELLRVSIAGEGPPHLVRNLQMVIEERGLSDKVKLIGNRLDVPDLLDRSDLFLMSSAWEGLPISLLEATVSGLPFIATDVGGCREVVELCGNGILVPPANPRMLADALGRLIDDCDHRTALSKAAVRNGFKLSIEQAAREYSQLYAKLHSRLDSAGRSKTRTQSGVR